MENNTEKNIVATIIGLGTVEAKNDQATFSLTLRTKGDQLSNVKEQIKEKTSQFLKELETKKMSLVGEITTSISNYKLEHREAGEKYSAGFQSTNDITWTTTIDHNLNDIYEMCLKYDPNMYAPIFSVKNRETLMAQAVEKSSVNLKEKLNNECKLLNISPEKLQVLKWNFSYGNIYPANNPAYTPQGVTGPAGSNATSNYVGFVNAVHQAPVQKLGSIYQELLDHKLTPGNISITASVNVSYIWKE